MAVGQALEDTDGQKEEEGDSVGLPENTLVKEEVPVGQKLTEPQGEAVGERDAEAQGDTVAESVAEGVAQLLPDSDPVEDTLPLMEPLLQLEGVPVRNEEALTVPQTLAVVQGLCVGLSDPLPDTVNELAGVALPEGQ